jgi:hypothetical protein
MCKVLLMDEAIHGDLRRYAGEPGIMRQSSEAVEQGEPLTWSKEASADFRVVESSLCLRRDPFNLPHFVVKNRMLAAIIPFDG